MSDVTSSRKVVTVLFSDLVESTSLAERLDAEALSSLLARYFTDMRSIIEAHGGTVEKFIGDAVVGVFGVPAVHEDDAARAVRSALNMQDSLATGQLRARIGINTGEVAVSDAGQSLAIGHAVNMAARLQQAAKAGEVLIGEQTRALVADAFVLEVEGPLEVRGSSQPINAWRVAGERAVLPRGWANETLFVGREREIDLVLDTIDESRRSRSCATVIILAPPGIGKSRLAAEVVRRMGEGTRVLVGRCLPYGESVTYAPLVELLTQIKAEDGKDAVSVAMATETDADLVASVIGPIDTGSSKSSPDEIAWAFRRLLETLAAKHPVVVVLDDLHWADPLLLDLVEYIAAFSVGVPLTLIGLSRPELLDARPSLITSRPPSALVRLEPLSTGEIFALLGASDHLDEDRRSRIAEAAGGVPLFAEQMAASEQEGTTEVPATVRALLAARVDRLEPVDRRLLEIGAVEGEVFMRKTITDLSADESRMQIGGRLISLVQRDFVRPERSMPGADAFRFSHALMRDAVYAQMPRLQRSELHERYAQLLSSTGNGSTPQDVIGHHLAIAHDELRILGDEARSRDLAVRAGKALLAAGTTAVARKQWQRGVDLLTRARELLAEDPARVIAAPDLINAYASMTNFQARDAVYRESLADARTVGDRTSELRIEMARIVSDAGRNVEGWPERVHDIGQEALDYFSSIGDDANIAEALIVLSQDRRNVDYQALIELYERAFPYAERGGNESAQIILWDELGGVMIGGPTPWPEIRDFMTREIAWAEERGIAFTAADGLLGLAYAQEAAGEIDEARTTLARLREIFGSLPGEVPQYGETYQLSGHVERTAGNTEGSLAFYDRSREIFDGIGNLSWWHGSTTSKAHALIALGRLDEAEAALAEIEARGLTGSPRTESAKLSAGSLIALGRGDTESAVALGRRAVELANEASNLDSQGRARERLAEALIAAGDLAGGRAELEAAILAYSRKGASKHEQRAAHRLKSLGETPAV